jgi:hypothetical protein
VTLDELKKLEQAATPGPWEWGDPDRKDESDIVWFEPFTDGSTGKGFRSDLITRDSGVYGPDIPTCEFIIAARNMLPKLLAVADAAKKVQAFIYLKDLEEALAALEADDAP